ncbi:Hypothetical protein EAG7_04340 [Klebsiella aerogenes]|nr:Hypothetical protein EAG7_04340 [Klebsiella aerogenes]CCG32836.1 hypothetical protein [Klebsiella aerogenes EA1509E]
MLGGLICDSVPAQPETNSNANSTRPNRLFKLHLPAARFWDEIKKDADRSGITPPAQSEYAEK